jgi:hypothetical protein
MVGQPAHDTKRATTLAEERDQHRVLLIGAPSADDRRLLEQLRIVHDHAEEAADRDLVAIAVPESGTPPTSLRLTASDWAEVQRRFHLASGSFAVLLLGKDGGEKLRSGKPIPFDRLRSVIDAMPMRKEEMRAKAAGKH